jgi:adenosylcobinamide-phosphate synthase
MVPARLVIALPVFVLAAALVIDRLMGDPHTHYHPVALLGNFIGWWGKPGRYPVYLQRIAGVFFWGITVFAFAFPFFLFFKFAPWFIFLVGAPLLLKCCFAWRALEEHALAVVEALKAGVDAGREKVKLLVSRDTASLDKNRILSAAYESMTENLTDSIVSPLFYYSLVGLAGAAIFVRQTRWMRCSGTATNASGSGGGPRGWTTYSILSRRGLRSFSSSFTLHYGAGSNPRTGSCAGTGGTALGIMAGL